MAKQSFTSVAIHLVLLLAGLGLLVCTLFTPWVSGQAILGLGQKTIYPYQEENLRLVLFIPPFVLGVSFISAIYGLFTPQRLLSGIISFFLGSGTVALGIYIWKQIEANDIYFLGLSPLKLAEVRPDIGVLFLILGGGLVAIDGLVWGFRK